MNPERLLFVSTFCSTIGSGLIAGIFFAFSNFVMKALAKMPAPQGLVAMQHVNVTVLNPLFLGVFMGTALACLVAAILALLNRENPRTAYVLTGAALYLIGTFGVTVVFNIPLNDALAAAKPGTDEGTRVWMEYLTNWTFWNSVRTGAAVLSMIAFIFALRHPV